MKLLCQLLALFRPGEKLILSLFVLLNFVCSLLELLGIGAAVPFILLLTKPDAVHSNPYLKRLYEFINPGSFQEFMIDMAIGIIVFFLLKNVFMLLVFFLQQLFLRRTYEDMTDSLLSSYLAKPYLFFHEHSTSELLRNVQTVQMVLLGMLTPMLTLVSEAITIGVLSLFLLCINPYDALWLELIIGALVLLGLRVMKKKTQYVGHSKNKSDEDLIRNVTQGLGSIKETRILGNEKVILRQNRHTASQIGRWAAAANMLGVIPRFYVETLAVSAVFIMMVVMLRSGVQEERIVLELSLFVMAAARLMPSVTRISVAISSIRIYIPPFNNFYHDILEARANPERWETRPGAERMALKENLELRDVSFAYPGGRRILDAVSVRIEKNRKVGFVGPSGSGKTTLIDLMIGLLEPNQGEIMIDGKNISGDLRGWQANIGYIPQQIFIFNDTIRNNIALGIAPENIADESIRRVVKIAQLEQMLARLPDGLDTMIGENGINLSGGERQRLGIARALYRDPEVLVMDEATAALDNQTEKDFIAAVDAIAGQKTILIIAHRLTTIQNCDKIYHVEDGKVWSDPV